jgi:hypothetical protein
MPRLCAQRGRNALSIGELPCSLTNLKEAREVANVVSCASSFAGCGGFGRRQGEYSALHAERLAYFAEKATEMYAVVG